MRFGHEVRCDANLAFQVEEALPVAPCCQFAPLQKYLYSLLVEAGRRIAFHVDMDVDIAVLYVLIVLFHPHQVDDLPRDVGQRVELVGTDQPFLHIDTDDDVGTHLPGNVHRIVVDHAAVDQHHPFPFHRLEHAGDGHAGAHGKGKLAAVEHILLAVDKVFGYAGKRDRKLVEVDGVVIAHRQFGEETGNVAPGDDASLERVLGLVLEGNGECILFRALFLDEQFFIAVHGVGEDEAPVLHPHEAVHLCRCIADGIQSADDGPHAGADHIVDGDSCLLDDLQRADMCHSLGSSSAQDNCHLLAGRLGCLCGEDACQQQQEQVT